MSENKTTENKTTRFIVRNLANGGRTLHSGTDPAAASAFYDDAVARSPSEPIELVMQTTLAETPAVAQMRADLRKARPWAPD